MASGAVFKLNCPRQMRSEQSCSLTWAPLFFWLFLFPTLKTAHYLPLVFSHSQFLCLSSFFRSLFFPPLPPNTPFLASASRILGMQIWICKCYGKRRSRCVTARTESGQHGRTDMPCMQVKLVYNMAPRGQRTRARSLNGWIPNSSFWCEWKGPPLSVSQGRSRRGNYASHEGLYSFISVRIPVSRRSCQAALYGNEQNLRDEWNWVQKCDIFSAARCCACQPGRVQVSMVWGYHLILGNESPETRLHNRKVKLITTNKVLNDGLIDSKITAA